MLRYDGTAARWQAIARPAVPGTLLAANNLSELSAKSTARDNLSIHGADIASASTINLETATGNLVDVTGTTTISAITLGDGHERAVRFTGALTLTNGASLVLPGGANITTAAGDFAVFRGYASGVVRCASYNPAAKADARNLIGATGNLVALTVFTASATWTRAAAQSLSSSRSRAAAAAAAGSAARPAISAAPAAARAASRSNASRRRGRPRP